MADDVIISARGLGKKYVIGHRSAERVPTLRDAIVRNTKGFLRTGGDMLRGNPLVGGDTREEFWALKDVDFDIRRGDVLGIIGRNGAGKSTLLKILSRITEPSEGRVEIDGRVASLLEVGTGFHPELTGRENIYLNGAVLGMRQAEIRRKFDEIVAFAEVEKFLDTPVKRYSSGMYVRLAFAVAAHLEPEILIVDEVLAVGDAEFQKKCLGKMQDVAGHGRTVLFVSHNLQSIQTLCTQGLHLASGQIVASGSIEETVQHYVSAGSSVEMTGVNTDLRNRYGTGSVKFERIELLNAEGFRTGHVPQGGRCVLVADIVGEIRPGLIFTAICMTRTGQKILLAAADDDATFKTRYCSRARLIFRCDYLPLQIGEFVWAVGCHGEEMHPIDVVLDALPFEIIHKSHHTGRRFVSEVGKSGFCELLGSWSFESSQAHEVTK
jgi:lipopolysaccharide transport system ATP-binding protein